MCMQPRARKTMPDISRLWPATAVSALKRRLQRSPAADDIGDLARGLHADGFSPKAIAHVLGISRSKTFIELRLGRDRSTWKITGLTREYVLEAGLCWHARTGRLPSSRDWSPNLTHADFERSLAAVTYWAPLSEPTRFRPWPEYRHVTRLFGGGWPEYLQHLQREIARRAREGSPYRPVSMPGREELLAATRISSNPRGAGTPVVKVTKNRVDRRPMDTLLLEAFLEARPMPWSTRIHRGPRRLGGHAKAALTKWLEHREATPESVNAPPEAFTAGTAAGSPPDSRRDGRLVELLDRHGGAPRFSPDTPGRYLGFFQSQSGGQVVLMHNWGDYSAMLYVGRNQWTATPVEPTRDHKPDSVALQIELSTSEEAWLAACWLEIEERNRLFQER